MYDNEPWAALAREAGFEPFDTESAAREAFRFAAEQRRDQASIARGERRARLKLGFWKAVNALERQKLRALEDIDNIALTLGEVSP
jgi:hypothetical protein